MTTSLEFCQALSAQGFDFFTGVPDSTFRDLLWRIEHISADAWIPAVSEDIAIGLAVGAYLGGRTPVVLMQSSGLGLSVNALASLALLCRVPLLLLIGWRGYRGRDAPEHLPMGEALPALLEILQIPYEVLGAAKPTSDLRRAVASMKAHSRPAAVLLRQGVLDDDPRASDRRASPAAVG